MKDWQDTLGIDNQRNPRLMRLNLVQKLQFRLQVKAGIMEPNSIFG